MTSYRRITQTHDGMEPSATSVVLVQLFDRSMRNNDRELFYEETKFGWKLDCVPVRNYG